MKYRKKPVVIEAYQTDKELDIETLEGTMRAHIGDYIITGVRGEQYPCKPDIFEQTYEPADAPASPWHRVEEPPKEEGRYWFAVWFDGHWIFDAAWYTHDISTVIDVPCCERVGGFYKGNTEVHPDYWMPIEPPQEGRMPTNKPMPEYCRRCPNRGVCPIRWTWQSWYCPGKEVLEKQEVQE